MVLPKQIAVIGSGFSGLASAAYLAKDGYKVGVYEKNDTIGGRARQFEEGGFTFDMGPSWYWMPEVFESFYNDFGYTTEDFYQLDRLSPAFNMVFDNQQVLTIPDSYEDLKDVFEQIEPGSAEQLDIFMKDAKKKYDISFTDLIEQPSIKLSEFMNYTTISNAVKLKIFSSYEKLVAKHFSHPKLRSLMEFPVLFLGAKPKDTPALYSLMNYAGLRLGTWYPQGGFFSVIKAMKKICEDLGVEFHTGQPVEQINVKSNQVFSLSMNGSSKVVDGVIGSADYHHIESKLLEDGQRNYNEDYWTKRTFAPSSLIFYLGVNKKLEKLIHHTLFFDADFAAHATDIYDDKKWPDSPLFYVCAPSKTDAQVAPKDGENLFILMPIATGLEDTEELREQYYNKLMQRLEDYLGYTVREHVVVKKSYCVKDFVNDYNAYGGNAYGLANTLRQTAVLKPKIVNKKIKNLVYTGQLTVPGPGVPPSLISGKIAANVLKNNLNN